MVNRGKRKSAVKAVGSASGSGILNAQIAAARHFGGATNTGSCASTSSAWASKLASADPADREDGCIDISNLSQAPTNLPTLMAANVPQHLAAALNDEEMHVRTAAAAATRNVLLQLSVHNADASTPSIDSYINEAFCSMLATKLSTGFTLLVSPDSDAMQSNGQPLTEAHLKAIADAANGVQKPVVQQQQVADEKGDLLPVEGEEEVEAFETMRDAAFANVDELIQLVGVVADCSEAATEFFSNVSKCAVLPVLASAVEVGLDKNFTATLNRSRGTELFVSGAGADGSQLAAAAAEALHWLSRENEALGGFLASGLTPAQQQLFNDLTTAANAPTSPAMLLISLHLASALLNTSATVANAERAVGSVARALSTLPFAEWKRVLPLLTEGCDMAEELRKASVGQTLERLRALQLASDIFGEIVSVICQSHDDAEDDEASFAANPNSGIITNSGLLDQLLAILTDIFTPQDAVLQKALREVTDNPEVTAIQHAFAGVEVGIFGVASSLLHLLPVAALGPADIVWRTCVSVLTARHELVSESIGCPEGPLPYLAQMILQIESLTEMCWTVLRKDSASGNAVQIQPSDLDLFTRIAWEGYVSSSTIVFVISVVGCIGTRIRTAQTHTACGRFCVAVINHALTGVKASTATRDSIEDNMDIAVEASNILIDLFCDEDFDATVYIPIGVQAKLKEFLPVLQKHIASFGKKRSPKKSHFLEVCENVVGFIQYKQQHGC